MQEMIIWIAKSDEFESKDIQQFFKHSCNIYRTLNIFVNAEFITKIRTKGKIKLKYKVTHKGIVFASLLSSLDRELSHEFGAFEDCNGLSIHIGVIRNA